MTTDAAGPLPFVLSLCDRTGVMVQPWLDAGYACVLVDAQHEHGVTHDGNLWRIGTDVRTYAPDFRPAIVFAFPPCTDLAVSGAKHFKDKGLEALRESLDVVIACKRICEASTAPWMLENPIGTLSTYWREPDHLFDPWQYARYLQDVKQDAYTKKTCLWTGGGFVMPPMKPASWLHDADRIHKMARTKDRGDKRAVTLAGFARAVFEANDPW
jgi:hypothetical protein